MYIMFVKYTCTSINSIEFIGLNWQQFNICSVLDPYVRAGSRSGSNFGNVIWFPCSSYSPSPVGAFAACEFCIKNSEIVLAIESVEHS